MKYGGMSQKYLKCMNNRIPIRVYIKTIIESKVYGEYQLKNIITDETILSGSIEWLISQCKKYKWKIDYIERI